MGSVLPPEAIAARVGGELRDLSFVPGSEAAVEAVSPAEDDGLHVLRHSTAHVLARAVCDLRPGTKYAIGPAIDDGFYYDFELREPLSSDDLAAIETRMRELISADVPFVREEVPRAEALDRFSDQPFKVEIIEGLGGADVEGEVAVGDSVTVYRNGSWSDLCLGPHVPSTGRLGAFRLTNVAGAYWRGDETAADVDAHLRHCLGDGSGPRCVPGAAGGSGEARPPQARAPARSLLLARRAGSGPVDLAPARRRLPQAARGLRARAAPPARLRPGGHPAHRTFGAVGDLGPPGEVRGQHVSAHADGHGRLLRETHELSVPRAGLQVSGSLVPRPADAVVGARNHLPARTARRAPRSAAHPRRHAGRLAHHLHARPVDRRDPQGVRADVRDPRHVRVRRSDREPVDAARTDDPGREDGRARHRGAGDGPRQERDAVHRSRGGGDVLRAEGRLPFQGRDRSPVAAHHGAVRLRAARAVRHAVHRGRQRPAPSGHDPPRRSSARWSGSARC